MCSLLQERASCARVRVRDLAGEVRLGLEEVLEPLLLGRAGDLELELDRAVHGLLVGVEVQVAGLAGRGGELLARLGRALERGVDRRGSVLGLGGCHYLRSWISDGVSLSCNLCLQISTPLASGQALFAVPTPPTPASPHPPPLRASPLGPRRPRIAWKIRSGAPGFSTPVLMRRACRGRSDRARP